MKRLLFVLLLLGLCDIASAQSVYQRKYGVATTINFSLWKLDATGLKTDAADGGTDCSIIKDEGTETTCTNDFADEGSSYSIALSATEMQAARIVVHIIDQSSPQVYLDKVINVETYGQTNSAQHPDSTYATAQAIPDTTHIQLAAAETYANDELNNNTSVMIVSATTGAGQTRCITDYVGSTDTAEIGTAWTTSPTGTVVYTLIPTPNCNALSSLGTDAISAASISSAAGSKLADIIMRRNTSNVEASSYGDTVDRKSLLGAVSQQTHKVSISGGTMTIYKSDGVTSLGTRSATSTAGANPITSLGN